MVFIVLFSLRSKVCSLVRSIIDSLLSFFLFETLVLVTGRFSLTTVRSRVLWSRPPLQPRSFSCRASARRALSLVQPADQSTGSKACGKHGRVHVQHVYRKKKKTGLEILRMRVELHALVPPRFGIGDWFGDTTSSSCAPII